MQLQKQEVGDEVVVIEERWMQFLSIGDSEREYVHVKQTQHQHTNAIHHL